MEFHLNRNLSLQNPGNIRGSVNSVIGERWIIFKKCNRFSSGVWACVELLVLLTPRLHSYFLAASERCSASICGSVLIETTRVLLAFRSSRLLEEFLRWKLWNLHNHGKPSPRCYGRMFLFSRERRNINPKTHWNRNDGISAKKDEKTRFFFHSPPPRVKKPRRLAQCDIFLPSYLEKVNFMFSVQIHWYLWHELCSVLHQDSFPPHNIEMNAIIFLWAHLIQEGLCCFLCPHVQKILVHIERQPGNWTF